MYFFIYMYFVDVIGCAERAVAGGKSPSLVGSHDKVAVYRAWVNLARCSD